MTEPCIFCRIAEGQVHAHIVWEDAAHLAFLDTSPVTSGHVLLIPRVHVRWVDELTLPAYRQLFECVRQLMRPVAVAAGAPRTGIVVEGFGVAHAHVHMIPIWQRGDLDPGRQYPATVDALQDAAVRLRAAIASEGAFG